MTPGPVNFSSSMKLLLLITAVLIATCVVKVQTSKNFSSDRKIRFIVETTNYNLKKHGNSTPSRTNSTNCAYKLICTKQQPSKTTTENNMTATNKDPKNTALSKEFFPKLKSKPKQKKNKKSSNAQSTIPACEEISEIHNCHSEQVSENNANIIAENLIFFEDSFSNLSLNLESTKQSGKSIKSPYIQPVILDCKNIFNNYDHLEQIPGNNLNTIKETLKTPFIFSRCLFEPFTETPFEIYQINPTGQYTHPSLLNDFLKNQDFQSISKRESIFDLEYHINVVRKKFDTARCEFEKAKLLYDTYAPKFKELHKKWKENNEAFYQSNDSNIHIEEITDFLDTWIENDNQREIMINYSLEMNVYKGIELATLENLFDKMQECKLEKGIMELEELCLNAFEFCDSLWNCHRELKDSINYTNREVLKIKKTLEHDINDPNKIDNDYSRNPHN